VSDRVNGTTTPLVHEKFARVFKKSPIQLSLIDFDLTTGK
jgi:hypothetical protein